MMIGASSQFVLVPEWKVRPQRLKAHPWQFGYPSGEPLRHPKSSAIADCYGCERILTNCARLRGTNGEAAIWPSNFFDQRPGAGAWQAGQSPSGVSLYFSMKYP